jgi:hypothetical protein
MALRQVPPSYPRDFPSIAGPRSASMSEVAFRACYADWKLIKTRSVIQVIMEIPIHDADAAYRVLGGMPAPASERWFGIAALATGHARPQPVPDKPPAGAKQKKDWRDVPPSQQAGIRCDEPVFAAFLKGILSGRMARKPGSRRMRAAYLRRRVPLRCSMTAARVIWTQLNSQFEAWKALEHA